MILSAISYTIFSRNVDYKNTNYSPNREKGPSQMTGLLLCPAGDSRKPVLVSAWTAHCSVSHQRPPEQRAIGFPLFVVEIVMGVSLSFLILS